MLKTWVKCGQPFFFFSYCKVVIFIRRVKVGVKFYIYAQELQQLRSFHDFPSASLGGNCQSKIFKKKKSRINLKEGENKISFWKNLGYYFSFDVLERFDGRAEQRRQVNSESDWIWCAYSLMPFCRCPYYSVATQWAKPQRAAVSDNTGNIRNQNEQSVRNPVSNQLSSLGNHQPSSALTTQSSWFEWHWYRPLESRWNKQLARMNFERGKK
jgi:hypothetical protein